MKLFAVGLNHRTAPVELRERLAVPREQLGDSLSGLVARAGLSEVMLLSTCNRVEVYGVGADPTGVVGALAAMRGVTDLDLSAHCFTSGEQSAARHIFRVTASLESMVVGEPQILGQVKDAYEVAREVGTIGTILDRCLTMAFRGAKRVRTETEIARGAASVPSVAVAVATSIFGSLAGRRILLVGAGEMSEQAGLHLRSGGASAIVVVSKTPERGRALADAVEGRWAPWDELGAELARADVVVSSTGSPTPVIDAATMKTAMRARRGAPIFVVDIAVPRDVAPAVGELEQVFLYDIDDLQRVLAHSLESRAAQTELASRVVEEEIGAFLRWERARAAAPVLQRLQEHGRGLAAEEIRKVLARLRDASPEHREAVETLAHQLVQKLLHRPMTAVRQAAEDPRGDAGLPDALVRLFGLDGEPEPGDDGGEP
jgi:glutamyl-tRNA reductase